MKKVRKKMVIIFILIVVFGMFFQYDVFADEEKSNTSESTNWWIYDHTDFENRTIISDSMHKYIERYDLDKNNMYNSHIELYNDNNTMKFIGYNKTPISDFVYYPSNNQDTQNFELVIRKQVLETLHTFRGIIIFFNTTITGNYNDNNQYMSGYMLFIGGNSSYPIQLYEFDNINTKTIHQYGVINYNGEEVYDIVDTYNIREGFNLIASGTTGAGKYISPMFGDFKIKIETTPTTLKTYFKDSEHLDDTEYTNDDTIRWNNSDIVELNQKSSTGFGVGIQYSIHNCNRMTIFEISNIKMPVPIKLDYSTTSNESDNNKSNTEAEKDCTDEKYAKSHKSECNSCDNEEYRKEHKDMCTTVSCNGTEMKLRDVKTLNRLFEYIKTILNIVKICVPIILILMGTIDMVKAMIANNEDSKKNYNFFIRRCIYAVCIFLLGTLINFVLGLVGAKYYDCDEVAISDNSEVSMINK